MKNVSRILCAVLALAMLLTGCAMPKITLPGTPAVAATYGDQEISTGEYLAYLYLNFEQVYSNYSYLVQYQMDPWTSEYAKIPYDNAAGETVQLGMEEYIRQITQDTIKQNIVLEQMMADNGLSLIAEEAADIDKEIAEMPEGAYLPVGVSNENFGKVYKDLTLNQRSTFFGLYGEKGPRAVAETDIRKYFDTNYISYKMISVPLTKTNEKNETVALTADEKAAELKKLNEYLAIYNEKGFEAAMDAYNKANAKEGETVEPTKDEDNRQDVDATEFGDDALLKAIRGVEVGKAKVVEYGGEEGKDPTTAALIVRLDINKPAELYTDSKEAILIAMKSEEFEKEVKEKVNALAITFNEKVLKKCDPKDFAPAQ